MSSPSEKLKNKDDDELLCLLDKLNNKKNNQLSLSLEKLNNTDDDELLFFLDKSNNKIHNYRDDDVPLCLIDKLNNKIEKKKSISSEKIKSNNDNQFPFPSKEINNKNDDQFLFPLENENNNNKIVDQFTENTNFKICEKENFSLENINIENDKLYSIENINNKSYGRLSHPKEKLNNKNDEQLFLENKIYKTDIQFPQSANKENKNLLSPSNNNIKNNSYPKIEIDLLEIKERHIDIIKRFEDGDGDESIQYNFETILNINQLILPIFLYLYIKKPKIAEIIEFNKYMLKKYSTEKKLVNLFKQINFEFQIPNEVISKYWVRAYIAETNFYKDMNKDLRLGKIDKYLPFIYMMYNGVNIKSFSYEPNCKLYRGAFFEQAEIDRLELSLKNKCPGLPHSIIYSKCFLSFSLNKKIAMRFKKNVLLIIEEFSEKSINCHGCAAVKKFSFIKSEEEILVFPFSCFELKGIEKIKGKGKRKRYYIMHLNYLGKYEGMFRGMGPDDLIEDIPRDSLFAQEVFSTDMIKEK